MTKPASKDCELLELYLLGGLSEEEAAAFEEHIKQCEACRVQRSELQEIIGQFPLAADPIPVPSGMKERILGRVLSQESEPAVLAQDQEANRQRAANTNTTFEVNTDAKAFRSEPIRKKSYPIARYLSIGLAAAMLVLVPYTLQLRQTVGNLQSRLDASPNAPIQELKVNQAVKLHPAAEDIVAQGLATIVIDKTGTHLLVQAEQLPELEGTQAFQVWMIKGEDKYSAGTFIPDSGTGAIYYTLQDQGYDTIAITLEPDAFGDTPRGEIVLAAPLDA
ncbi:anti-sigma factor [Paenibacillus sp. sgz302251]|uniref:anti-sigma factor n=1 Tax=Paenibacillus sp. sgz302251 TaxID=3414493 RepID=UPI003C7B3D65